MTAAKSCEGRRYMDGDGGGGGDSELTEARARPFISTKSSKEQPLIAVGLYAWSFSTCHQFS